MIIRRIIIDFVLFLGVFLFPFWINLLIGIICLFLFRNFYEFVIFSLLADLLYGGGTRQFLGIPFALSSFALLSYALVFFSKNA